MADYFSRDSFCLQLFSFGWNESTPTNNLWQGSSMWCVLHMLASTLLVYVDAFFFNVSSLLKWDNYELFKLMTVKLQTKLINWLDDAQPERDDQLFFFLPETVNETKINNLSINLHIFKWILLNIKRLTCSSAEWVSYTEDGTRYFEVLQARWCNCVTR